MEKSIGAPFLSPFFLLFYFPFIVRGLAFLFFSSRLGIVFRDGAFERGFTPEYGLAQSVYRSPVPGAQGPISPVHVLPPVLFLRLPLPSRLIQLGASEIGITRTSTGVVPPMTHSEAIS